MSRPTTDELRRQLSSGEIDTDKTIALALLIIADTLRGIEQTLDLIHEQQNH